MLLCLLWTFVCGLDVPMPTQSFDTRIIRETIIETRRSDDNVRPLLWLLLVLYKLLMPRNSREMELIEWGIPRGYNLLNLFCVMPICNNRLSSQIFYFLFSVNIVLMRSICTRMWTRGVTTFIHKGMFMMETCFNLAQNRKPFLLFIYLDTKHWMSKNGDDFENLKDCESSRRSWRGKSLLGKRKYEGNSRWYRDVLGNISKILHGISNLPLLPHISS